MYVRFSIKTFNIINVCRVNDILSEVVIFIPISLDQSFLIHNKTPKYWNSFIRLFFQTLY